MTLDEELKQLRQNTKKDIRQLYEKVKQYPLFSLFFILVALSLVIIPYLQVNYQGIINNAEKATLENQYRATLAQILGGVAIGIGLYYTWRRINIAERDLKVTQENLKVAQDNLKVTQENLEATQKVAQENLKISQEGQITERFTRAVDQLGAIDQAGNPAIEIRLGGIYALERIVNESKKDYWPIIEILTAYVRKNSSIEDEYVINQNKISLDIQAILTVIGRRRHLIAPVHLNLDLQRTYLRQVDLIKANLEWANLKWTNLERAVFMDANLEHARFIQTNLERAIFLGANLRGVVLKEANLTKAHFEEADLNGADLEGADLEEAYLERAKNLTVDQLSKVKTLYNAKLDKELEIPLKEKYPALFEKPDQEEV